MNAEELKQKISVIISSTNTSGNEKHEQILKLVNLAKIEYAKLKCKEQRYICRRNYETERNTEYTERLKDVSKNINTLRLTKAISNAPEPTFD